MDNVRLGLLVTNNRKIHGKIDPGRVHADARLIWPIALLPIQLQLGGVHACSD
jgi:hypothetical protein